MSRVTLNARRATIFNRDEHTTGVRTIVRTSGVDGLLHCFAYTGIAISVDVAS